MDSEQLLKICHWVQVCQKLQGTNLLRITDWFVSLNLKNTIRFKSLTCSHFYSFPASLKTSCDIITVNCRKKIKRISFRDSPMSTQLFLISQSAIVCLQFIIWISSEQGKLKTKTYTIYTRQCFFLAKIICLSLFCRA